MVMVVVGSAFVRVSRVVLSVFVRVVKDYFRGSLVFYSAFVRFLLDIFGKKPIIKP